MGLLSQFAIPPMLGRRVRVMKSRCVSILSICTCSGETVRDSKRVSSGC